MKKIYFTIISLFLLTFSSFAEHILVVGIESTNENYDIYMIHIQMVADEIASLDGITTHIEDADVVTSGTYDFSPYDAIVITEAAGSSTIKDIGTYTTEVVTALPVLNMKLYAIHDGKGGWDWCPSSDFYGNADNWDTNLVDEQTIMEIEANHDIFVGVYIQGDEVLLFEHALLDGPHFQTVTFDNSAVDDIKTNAEGIGISKFVTEDSPTSPSTMMFAIEENTTCKRNVLWGVHSRFDNPTDAFKMILKNSVLWILKKEITNTKSFVTSQYIRSYPNPVKSEVNLEFILHSDQTVIISVFDITGKEVYSNMENYTAGKQIEKIDVSSLAKGVYFYQIRLNGQFYSDRIAIY